MPGVGLSIRPVADFFPGKKSHKNEWVWIVVSCWGKKSVQCWVSLIEKSWQTFRTWRQVFFFVCQFQTSIMCMIDFPFFTDLNECRRSKPCSHTCQNTRGSFHCACPVGYSLSADQRTCRKHNTGAHWFHYWLHSGFQGMSMGTRHSAGQTAE